MGFQTLLFFPSSPFSSGGTLFFNHVSLLRLQNSWQSFRPVLSPAPGEELCMAASAKSQLQKVIQGQIPPCSELPSTPTMGINVCPAPGRNHPMPAVLHNLQAPLCAVTQQLHWSCAAGAARHWDLRGSHKAPGGQECEVTVMENLLCFTSMRPDLNPSVFGGLTHLYSHFHAHKEAACDEERPDWGWESLCYCKLLYLGWPLLILLFFQCFFNIL